MPSSIYTKLTPANRSLSGYTQLWLASDHILLLISSRFAEDYKRFAFADIQSIVVTEMPSRIVPQVIMILASLAWSALWFTVDIAFFKWMFVVTGALALLWSIRDISRGPRCRCYLRTRVSKELLAPVSHLRIARKFLATVRPLAEAAQGVLPPQADPAEISSSSWEPPPPELIASPGYVPEVLFAVFIVNAILIAASIRFPKVPEIPGILINSLLAELLLIAVALLRRKGRDTRIVIYVVIGLSILGFAFDVVTIARQLFGWYLTTVEKARNGDKTTTAIELFPAERWRATVAYSWRAAAGVIGMAAAFYERRIKRT